MSYRPASERRDTGSSRIFTKPLSLALEICPRSDTCQFTNATSVAANHRCQTRHSAETATEAASTMMIFFLFIPVLYKNYLYLCVKCPTSVIHKITY